MKAEDMRSLRDLMADKCIERGDFILSSGLPAKYYYDGKFATLNPRSARIIGKLCLELVRESGAEAVGGMAVGADPIAQSVALASLDDDGGDEIPAFIVRPEAKSHGKKDQVSAGFAADGRPLLTPGRKVAIVDDVITTGGSVRGAIDAVQAEGCEIVLVLVLVERHERGGLKLEAEGLNFKRLFYTEESGELKIDAGLLHRAERLSRESVLR